MLIGLLHGLSPNLNASIKNPDVLFRTSGSIVKRMRLDQIRIRPIAISFSRIARSGLLHV